MLMRLFVLAVVSVAMFSCKSETEKFVDKYKQFTTDLSENYLNYNSGQRDSLCVQYRVLRDRAKAQEHEMTIVQRNVIDSCNYKINAILIRKTTKDAINSAGKFLHEAAGTIKELVK